MRYEVYADRIFFLHFGMNFLLLVLTAQLSGCRTGWKRMAKAAAFGSLLFVCVLLLPLGSFRTVRAAKTALLALGTLAELETAFGTKKRRSSRAAWHEIIYADISVTAEASCLYIAAACALGGALAAVRNTGERMSHILLPAAAATAGGAWMIAACRRRQKDPLWTARIRVGEKSCRVTALVDSGNSLFDPVSKRPVCIVQREVSEQLGLLERPERFRLIPYHSIGRQHGLLRAAPAEEIYLQKGGQKRRLDGVLLAVSDQPLSCSGRYQMLLHPALLEETKGADKHDIESSDAGKDAV